LNIKSKSRPIQFDLFLPKDLSRRIILKGLRLVFGTQNKRSALEYQEAVQLPVQISV
jgi:hypothetical protein